jgi:son of sevenless-like protein
MKWDRPNLARSGPNLLRLVDRFNQFSIWLGYLVINESDLKKRVSVVVRLLRIARECFQLNNFFALFEFYAGLQQNAVFRLKRTWEVLRKEHSKEFSVFEEIQELAKDDNNYVNYRKKLTSTNTVCVPYIGVYQKDLIYLSEIPTRFPNGYINFHKMRSMAEIVMKIQSYQHYNYNLLNEEVNKKKKKKLNK